MLRFFTFLLFFFFYCLYHLIFKQSKLLWWFNVDKHLQALISFSLVFLQFYGHRYFVWSVILVLYLYYTGVVPVISCYNFLKVACIIVSYPYLCPNIYTHICVHQSMLTRIKETHFGIFFKEIFTLTKLYRQKVTSLHWILSAFLFSSKAATWKFCIQCQSKIKVNKIKEYCIFQWGR